MITLNSVKFHLDNYSIWSGMGAIPEWSGRTSFRELYLNFCLNHVKKQPYQDLEKNILKTLSANSLKQGNFDVLVRKKQEQCGWMVLS